ncbi:hypothetical protein ACLOJK_005934 [Asimina triloba]
MDLANSAIHSVSGQGTVKLIFQPAEEGHAGAFKMLNEGPFMATSARFVATIQGRGGHAARPHDSKDPVLAASFVILSLQMLVSRESDPLDSRVVFL